MHQFATSVVQRLVDAGFIAYFAGGWVRDFLMQRPSDDIDIATSATVDQVQALFPKTVPVGVAFGIILVIEGGHPFEVATFRKDRGYTDGRRPTGIDPAGPEEDAQRRDFTINGMFYDPLKNQLFDYVNGQQDIKNKLIRAIGNPHDRFLEDRLRMMRAVRYATRFDFPIEPSTVEAILDHASTLLPSVAMERVWQEFKKMAQFAHFNRGLVMLQELRLLPTIFPELKDLTPEEIEKRTSAIPHFPKNTPAIAELLELFTDTSLQGLLDLCEKLKLSRQEQDFVRFYHHARELLKMPTDWQNKLELIEWAQFYANPSTNLCIEIFAAHYPKEKKEHFLQEHRARQLRLKKVIERLTTNQPVVRAEHLIQAGIAPGKKMGTLLKEAERIAVNDSLDDPHLVIAKLKASSLWD